MVSVFEGQLTRTWCYPVGSENDAGTSIGTKRSLITLYHDTITGVRSAMLNYEEIPGTLGNSSLLMEKHGHQLSFLVDHRPAYIEIKRKGWMGFTYQCYIDGVLMQEATAKVAHYDKAVFTVSLNGTVTTPDRTGQLITWYVLRTTRVEDNVSTTVHRRFRDFAELNSQVKQNFKGHHLRSSLPSLPEKWSKLTTDHKDPDFIEGRYVKLEYFIRALVDIPHVPMMTCTKAFCGILDRVREVSLYFENSTLGMHLVPAAAAVRPGTYTSGQGQGQDNQDKHKKSYVAPAIISSIQDTEACQGLVSIGDAVSRVNGSTVSELNFNGLIARIKSLPRPIVIHFVQLISKPKFPSQLAAERAAAAAAVVVSATATAVAAAAAAETTVEDSTAAVVVASATTTPTHPIDTDLDQINIAVEEEVEQEQEPVLEHPQEPQQPQLQSQQQPEPEPEPEQVQDQDQGQEHHHRPYRWQPVDRPLAARHTSSTSSTTPTKNTSSSSAGSSSGNGSGDGGLLGVSEEDEDDEATGQRSQVSLGHQADLIEQMLGGVHLSLSNSQGGNNAGGDSNLPVGGVLDEGGQSPGWVGEEVEEEADV